MTANQFRLFAAIALVALIVGFLGWQASQRQARIALCVERSARPWQTAEQTLQECEKFERAGVLRRAGQ